MTQIRRSSNNRMPTSARASSPEPSPDTPHPSIESPGSSHAFSSSDTSASQNENAFRTPSISVSPPPAPSSSQPAESSNSQAFDPRQPRSPTANEIADGMSQLHLAKNDPLSNFHDLATALEASDGGRASSVPGEAVATGHTPPRQVSLSLGASPRRRRSSSRTTIVPHDITKEVPLDDKFNSKAFQRNLTSTKALVQDLKLVLGSNALHQQPDSKMHILHQDASRLVNFRFPKSRIVGFVGDSGAGKSSLLNSLLDKPGLVRTSNSGRACTCVVTEFHYHELDSFSIDVQLFGEDQLLEQLGQMLSIYRQAKLHIDEITDRKDREDVEKAAELAESTLGSMFRGSLLLEEEFLVNADETEVLGRMRSFVSDILPTISNGVLAGLTKEACTHQLSRLSSDTAEDEPARWPYISKIRVNLNAHILSRGLILVDLPGLRDLNSARRNITERFLLECNSIFAVCLIGRATTDLGVEEVFDLARQAKLSNVDIICTKSDDIKADEAKEDWKGQRAQRITEWQDAVEAAQTDATSYELEANEFAELDDISPEESAYLSQLITKQSVAKRECIAHKLQLQEFLIATRNAIVSRDLQHKYRSSMGSRNSMVFCVSNTMYGDYRYLDNESSQPYLQLSGIIRLRQYCISMVSDYQHRVATRFMRHDVPRLLNDIELWLQSGADTLDAEQRASVTQTMNGLQERLISSLLGGTSYLPTVSRVLLEWFTADIYEEQDILAWTALAQAAGREWDGWHHATYAAFCRNYGRHDTRAVGFRDWNEELIEGMVDDLTAPWQHLRNALTSRKARVINSVEASTDRGIEYLEAQLSNDIDRLQTLRRALRDYHSLLQGGIETAFEEAEESFRILGIKALSGLQTSFIGAAMEVTYRGCNAEYGTGSDRRRKTLMNRALSNQALFSGIVISLRNSFRSITGILQKSIDTAVDSYQNQVTGTLDLVRDENTAIESQQDPMFRNRVSKAFQNAREGMQSIREEVPELD